MAHGFKYKRMRRQTAAKLLQTQRRENFDKMMDKFETERKPYME